MIILVGLIVLLAVSIYLWKSSNEYSGWNMAISFISIVLGVLLITALIVLVVVHTTAGSSVSEYESTKAAIEQARSGEVSDVERAAMTQTIIETNMIIASHRYYNDTLFDIFYSDKIAELEPLK